MFLMCGEVWVILLRFAEKVGFCGVIGGVLVLSRYGRFDKGALLSGSDEPGQGSC
jgi:hypothetical protein